MLALRANVGSGLSGWLWAFALGIALGGCNEASQGQKKPAASKEDIAACNTNCEQLAKAEEPTCAKPVLEPQACHQAVQYAEADCKSLCDPEAPPLRE